MPMNLISPYINPFLAYVPILYPLETPENLWFSGVFKGYKMGTLAKNGLISELKSFHSKSEDSSQFFLYFIPFMRISLEAEKKIMAKFMFQLTETNSQSCQLV